MHESRSALGAALALAAACLFGVSGAIAGGVFSTIDPTRVAQVRSLVAAVLLVGYSAFRGTLRPGSALGRFAILGLILALVNVTFYWAIERLGVGPGGTVQFLAPTFVLVWIAAVRKQPVSGVAWCAALAAVAGVGLVTTAWDLGHSSLAGLAAGLASAVLFAIYLVYGEYLGTEHPPSRIAAWGFVFASVLWAMVLPWWNFPFDAARGSWLDLLVIGVAGTALPFMAEFVALTLASSGVVGIVATAEPAIGAIAAAILLGQQLSAIQWLGVGVVVVSVAVVQRWGLGEVHPATPIA